MNNADAINRRALLKLAGRWRLERTIDTAVAATPASANHSGLTGCGEALLSWHQAASVETRSAAPCCLDYTEHGVLSNGLSFEKRYRFALTPAGVVITHADPHAMADPFQTVVFEDDDHGTLIAAGENLCGADHYTSRYEIANGVARFRHAVRGPSKAYVIVTTLSTHTA